MDIGAKIRQLRLKNKISQEELACKLGITQKSVSNIESGETIPDFLLMDKVCKTFNVDFTYFLEESNITNHIEREENITVEGKERFINILSEDIIYRFERLEKMILEKYKNT